MEPENSEYLSAGIARKFFAGYKNTTDRHYVLYKGQDTKNREAVA
jgi:hypothetical protein